eukprot:491780_1
MSLQQQEWKWEDDTGSFHSFQDNISPELDKLNIGECYTMHFRNKQYEIKKISKTQCTQRNTETNYARNVMLKSSTSVIKINKKNSNNNNNHHWYWEDDSGKLNPYSDEVSIIIEQLNIGDSHCEILSDVNIAYQIRKTATDTAQQTNLQTDHTRKVVKKSKQLINNNNIQSSNSDDIKQDFTSQNQGGNDGIIWYWKDDKNQFNAYDSVVSKRINNLAINDSMAHNTQYGKYELIKLSKNKGQQKNTKSNNIREIRRMSVNQMQSHNQNAGKYTVQNDDVSEDEKQSVDCVVINKWYFEDDKGVFNPMDDWLSNKIDNLAIGDIINQKIKQSTYQYKKTNLKKGTQRNIETNKVRVIKCAEYEWFFEDNDESLKPYDNDISKKLEATSIKTSFTFKKNKHTYCVIKLSKNHAKQQNISTKVERNVVRKMTLNDNNDVSDDMNEDWLRKRYNKALKSVTMDRVHLICKRNLHENWADNIFRTCESQFARSCDKWGKEANGLNKTINEVEFVINPKLIKKFEAKKKQMMTKNVCKESDLNVILAWHGTNTGNIENIVKNNFDLSKLGVNKKNKGYYGAGIYFSEFARISNVYGDGLLLCKVILGKEYQMQFGKPEIGRTLEPGYDSHVAVKPNSDYGREVCVFDVDQILPCYIVKY